MLLTHTSFAGASTPSAAIDTTGAKFLIASFASGSSGDVLTDSAGNTWTPLTAQTGAFGSAERFFYVINPTTSGSHTFQSSGTTPSACIAAFDDVVTFDQETGTSNNTSPAQGGALTPASATNLMFSGVGGGTVGPSIDSGYTITDHQDIAGGVNFSSALAYLAQVAATAQNPSWTFSVAATSGVYNAVFTVGTPPAAPDWFAGVAPDHVLAPPRVAPTWFTFPPLPQPNPPPVYCFRRPCTTDHTQAGGSDATNFKVPVFLFDPSMKTVAHGGDIQHTDTAAGRTVPADLAFFADSALTIPLVFEVELYDGLNGSLRAWVNLPTLSHTADVVFYLAYGSAAVTTFQGNIAATWANNFAGVWHLPTGSTNYDDSTGHGHTGTASGSVTPSAFGVFDGCSEFFGSPDVVNVGASADWNFAGSFTVSLWMQTPTNQTAFLVGVDGTSIAFELTVGSAPEVVWSVKIATGFANALVFINPFDGNWHHLVGVWSDGAAQALLYMDGALAATSAAGSTFVGTSSVALTLGRDAGAAFTSYVGLLDELHAVNALRSADWILSEYNSQKPGSTFLTIGSETFLCGVTVVPTIYPDWLARVPQTRGWYAAPPAPPVAPPWISVDAPDQVRRGETGRLGWDARPLLPPPAPAPTYFTDTFPDQVRSGTKAPEGWYTRPTTPPPAPPLIETTLPQARYGVPLTRTTYTAPVTPPAAPAPTYFVDVFPDQVRRAGHAAPDWLAEPILPPPVPYTEWGQTEPLHLRVSWRDLSDYTEPLRIIQNPVPPLSWGVIYPDHLTVVRSAALLGAAYHAPYGPTPPPHERPLYRRSLQLRIGSRTEPEKL